MKQDEDDWISKRIDEALQAHPVADDVASTIKERLAGTMRERTVRAGELTELAKILVDKITVPPCKETDK